MSMMNALLELKQRVENLDAPPKKKQLAVGQNSDMTHFVEVMEQVTSVGVPKNVQLISCLSAIDADAIQKSSALLARLENTVPEIVTGPIRLSSQYFTARGNVDFPLKSKQPLSKLTFIDISTVLDIKPSTKPFYVGLFTSTGRGGSYNMWRIYLESNRGFAFFALPWSTWAVEPSASAVVLEISSAADWVDFVLSNPQFENGLLYPDWKMVAKKCDAVHITLRAIVATQGFYFRTEQGIIAAPYWDVECTFWLHWCFDSVRLVEIVK